MRSNLQSPAGFHLAAFGQNGFDYLTGNAANLVGDFVAIQVLSQAVVTVTVGAGDALTSVAVPTGMTIYGPFKSINLASGTVLAYRA
jgi:hypothetical protein